MIKVKNSSTSSFIYKNKHNQEIYFRPGEVRVLNDNEMEFKYTDDQGCPSCGCHYLVLLDRWDETIDSIKSRFELMILE